MSVTSVLQLRALFLLRWFCLSFFVLVICSEGLASSSRGQVGARPQQPTAVAISSSR